MKTCADRSTQLLVVGAGPVGLFAALSAAHSGLEVTVLDQFESGFGRGRATILHAGTVKLFAAQGLAAELAAKGRAVHSVNLRVDGAPPVALKLPAPALALPQGVLEDVLLRALRHAGVAVWSPVEASAIQQDSSEVRVRAIRRELVTLGSPAEYSEWQPVESFVVNARYAIGADGYESRVRAALGIDLSLLGPIESFAMFDCATDASLDGSMDIGFDDGLVSSSLPLKDDHVRLGFQIASALDADADGARLAQLAGRMPWFTADSKVEWGAVMHFEQRLVRSFGHGRVWLAGDAAHVTSPFGAQSMNIGLAEAADLVARIHACVRGQATTDSLRNYGLARQREWHKLLGYHVTFELLPHAPAWVAACARKIAPVLPASGADLKDLLDQLGLAIN